MHGALRATCLLFIFLVEIMRVNCEPQVHILAENFEQVVTSSTLQWIPYNVQAEKLLKNAVVAAYQIKEVKNVTENGDQSNEDFKIPIYVCRAKVAAVWVPGQCRKDKKLCVVSVYKKVSEEKYFEILINRENRSRLSWMLKSKYTITPQGSVEGSDKIYIARRSVNYHNKEGALSHIVGNFNPGDNLGVFSLVDQNNKELKYEDGEILVEQEPVKYEFKHSKFDKMKSKHIHHPKTLGTATLKNEEEDVHKVDTVLSYNYTHYINWGKEHGLLIALPFSAEFPNGTKFNGKWGIPESIHTIEVIPIEKFLDGGTAVNLTLKGNYTESDIPYITNVTAFYKDNNTVESILRDSLLMKHVTGVIIEFSPVYFSNNNTLVPTTTTTDRTTHITTPMSQTQTIPVNRPNTEDVHVLDNKSENPMKNEHIPKEIPVVSSNDTRENGVQQLTKKNDSSTGNKIFMYHVIFIINLIFIQIT